MKSKSFSRNILFYLTLHRPIESVLLIRTKFILELQNKTYNKRVLPIRKDISISIGFFQQSSYL